MIKIAILASGSGTNAENIAKYFKGNAEISINLILTNKKDAYVIERAKNLSIPSAIFSKAELDSGALIDNLTSNEIDYIVLAGFLLKIPASLISRFPEKIINIHPALLPKYGGKGMYGHHVHNAVVNNKESESGITIHLVNEIYDDGEILFQDKCEVTPGDTADSVAEKIHKLEYEHFPRVIEDYILKKENSIRD